MHSTSIYAFAALVATLTAGKPMSFLNRESSTDMNASPLILRASTLDIEDGNVIVKRQTDESAGPDNSGGVIRTVMETASPHRYNTSTDINNTVKTIKPLHIPSICSAIQRDRQMGRPPMVYDWEGKENECYRLYVEERKSLDEVARYFKNEHGFAPSSSNNIQNQRWDFPSKQQPAHKNAPLVERVRQLWEVNTKQKEMLDILANEGFEIRERELMRLRAKNGWLMRTPNGTDAPFGGPVVRKKRRVDGAMVNYDVADGEQVPPQKKAALMATFDSDGQPFLSLPAKQKGIPRAMSPETERKRQERMDKLRAQSNDLLQTRKRRRRTRGWSGLPADPPLPPRYPSETTIDECKAFLHLENDTYQAMRDQFEQICRDDGVIKKTIAGPEKWQQVKERLTAENPKINREFHGPFNGVKTETKELALDVICMDVTKRMRVISNRMTIAEAKTVLAINPEQSRRVRNQFYEVLKADRFISKLEAGESHWEELKTRWVEVSDILQARMGTPEGVLDRTPERNKALDVLARDVQKRLRDEQAKADPTYVKQVNAGPGPGPASFQARRPERLPHGPPLPATSPYAPVASPPVKATKTPHAVRQASSQRTERIDPSLLAAASDSSHALSQLQQFAASASASDPQHQAPSFPPSTVPAQAPTTTTTPNSAHPQTQYNLALPIACLFRLSPASPIQPTPKVWLGTLATVSVDELHSQAGRQHPNFSVTRIEGMVPGQGQGQGAGESGLPIDREDELGAYLEYVAGSGKVAFAVWLQ
ncbi:MAG: hypothetical protein M1828_003562 [Chrysothrix sp. TS-e1954]|nr:MAG: hypothetical protein M1828_003562 [Chrysothrix sp. TS-e1954]